MEFGSAPRDHVPVGVIEVEEAPDLDRRQLAGEPAVGGDLLIGQALHRHESRPQTRATRQPSVPRSFPPLTAVLLFLNPDVAAATPGGPRLPTT
jgi:hypothetical protein